MLDEAKIYDEQKYQELSQIEEKMKNLEIKYSKQKK